MDHDTAVKQMSNSIRTIDANSSESLEDERTCHNIDARDTGSYGLQTLTVSRPIYGAHDCTLELFDFTPTVEFDRCAFAIITQRHAYDTHACDHSRGERGAAGGE